MPGAVNLGFSGEAVSTQSGTNNFSINGIRPDSISNIFDGADVEDPGCNCGAFATPSRELVAEVKDTNLEFRSRDSEVARSCAIHQ